MPKYTFLLPAYKAHFLRDAIQSILAQTYEDFHLFVSDDCSPENLHDIVQEFESDKRLTFCRNKENIGGKNLAQHWNMLVDMAESEYFILASDDDVYAPDFLQTIDSLTARYPKANVLRARIRFIDGEGNETSTEPLCSEFLTEEQAFYHNYSKNVLKCMSNYVFQTLPMKEHGGFIEFPLAWYSDIATVLREADNGIINTKEILFSFRMSGLNISSQEQTDAVATEQKLKAAKLYNRWMMRRIKERKLGQRIEHAHKQEMLRNALVRIKTIGLGELLYTIWYFTLHGYFDDASQLNWLVGSWYKTHCKR